MKKWTQKHKQKQNKNQKKNLIPIMFLNLFDVLDHRNKVYQNLTTKSGFKVAVVQDDPDNVSLSFFLIKKIFF